MSRRRTPHSSRSRRRSRSRSPPKSRSRHRRHRSPRSQSSSPCYDSSADELLPKRVAPAEPQPSFNALKTAQNFTADVEQMTVKDKMAHQAMITTNPAVTRLCRRVYIGNLPTEMGLTEPILLEFFAVLLRLKGISTPQALLSVWLSSPPAFGFLDMRSVSDTTKCLTILENFDLAGRPLKLGRPPDYIPPAPNLVNYVVGAVPIGFDSNRVIVDPAAHKIKKTADQKANEPAKRRPMNVQFPSTSGTRISSDLMPVKIKPTIDGGILVTPAFEDDEEEFKKSDPKKIPYDQLFASFPRAIRETLIKALPDSANLVPSLLDIDVMPSRPCPPSLVVVVENMVIPPELVDENEFRDIEFDIRHGATRYGPVAAVVIPRPGISPGNFGIGKVFIEYTTVKDAMNAQKYIPRRKFMNRRLVAKFYEEYKYKALIF